MTLRDVCNLYVCSRLVSAPYAAQLARTVKAFEQANPGVPVTCVGPEHIARFLAEIRRRTGNLNTLGNYVSQLSILLRHAERCGSLSRIPPIPRIPRVSRVPRAWAIDEFKRLYDVANRLSGRVGVHLARFWWPSLIATAYHTGSRIGALLKARWRDLDLQTGVLVLAAENTKTRTEQVFRLPDYVVAKIKELTWPPRELIWEWPYNRRYFWTVFRNKIAKPAKLDPLPGERFGLFHKVRRTAASLAAAQGGVAAAQMLLGHSSARTTIEHYIDPRIAVSAITLPSLE